MSDFKFWRLWLFGLSLLIICFGLWLAFFPQSPVINLLINRHLDPVFWPDANLGPEARRYQAWLYAVLGAAMAGWGVLMAFMVRIPLHRGEVWAWYALFSCFSLWYLVDSAMSLIHGAWFNALFNTLIFMAAALPLSFIKKYMHKIE